MADVWELRGQSLEHRSVNVAAAVELAADPESVVWIQVTADEMRHIGPLLDIHPRAVEEVVNNTNDGGVGAHRTKLERFPGCMLLYLYRSVLGDDTTLDLSASPVIITHESVIAVEHDHPIQMTDLVARWEQNPELLDHGIPALLYALLDLVVDSYLDTVDALSDAVDDMEDVLFQSQPDVQTNPLEAQKRSFATRKALVRLRRVAQPMRELVSGLMRHEEGERSTINASMQPYFQDVYDHVLRVNDTIEGLRDLITTIYETRLALNDHSLNTVTRQLAAWAAIIAVPTAVTGFYGQNIPYPGFADHSGFWTSTIIWVGVSALLYVMFKRRRWL
ncbi:MAG: magnesium transporter CorA family protein [Actinomycetia bacterium]|nr:magnesium transporter CorA family protein [Actinomycetes bacterium]